MFAKILCLVGVLCIHVAYAQLIVASKTLVCPNEPTQLKVNDKALNPFDFCVNKLNERFGLHYFKTCKQVTVEEAIIMAKMMNGHLATANEEQKNSFLFNLLPNDIHWIGFIQNPKAKNFNDPPNPASGWEWMSKASFAKAFWVDENLIMMSSTTPECTLYKAAGEIRFGATNQAKKNMSVLLRANPILFHL